MVEKEGKVANAAKWSSVTAIVSRLFTPISNMVLARLLTPEAFGVVTTLTMIITFAELFTDAGFQKYLIQHEFRGKEDREQSTNVAFWSNFVLSILIWGIIIVFARPLAALVGNPGLGHVLIVACVSIPLASFSSIQMALYQRDLDFKTLFKIRMVAILIPLVVTIPLAFWLRSYWALIIGTIVQNVVNAVLLTWFSQWKPSLYFSWNKLHEMLSFTVWSLIEAISIWLTAYVDVFIVGTKLSQYYLGLYKTSSTLVAQIMGLITAATTPVLFSSLSRLQNNEGEFKKLFLKIQKMVAILVMPIGVVIYCFSDFVTNVLLGEQWLEASGFIGLWGITSAVTIVLSHYSSEVYRAKGRPKLSVLSQWLHIIVLWPVVVWAVRYGFETLYISRSLVRFESIAVNVIIMQMLCNITILEMFKNILPTLVASLLMFAVASLLHLAGDSIMWILLAIFLCSVLYGATILSFSKERELLKAFFIKIKP